MAYKNFVADVVQTVSEGNWNFKADPGTGSISLTFSLGVDDDGVEDSFDPVTDADFTAYESGIILISGTRLKAGLTGDATFKMSKVATNQQ